MSPHKPFWTRRATINSRAILETIHKSYIGILFMLDNSNNLCKPNKFFIVPADEDTDFEFQIYELLETETISIHRRKWVKAADLDARSPTFFEDLDKLIRRITNDRNLHKSRESIEQILEL